MWDHAPSTLVDWLAFLAPPRASLSSLYGRAVQQGCYKTGFSWIPGFCTHASHRMPLWWHCWFVLQSCISCHACACNDDSTRTEHWTLSNRWWEILAAFLLSAPFVSFVADDVSFWRDIWAISLRLQFADALSAALAQRLWRRCFIVLIILATYVRPCTVYTCERDSLS